jgi:hypothetical protein
MSLDSKHSPSACHKHNKSQPILRQDIMKFLNSRSNDISKVARGNRSYTKHQESRQYRWRGWHEESGLRAMWRCQAVREARTFQSLPMRRGTSGTGKPMCHRLFWHPAAPEESWGAGLEYEAYFGGFTGPASITLMAKMGSFDSRGTQTQVRLLCVCRDRDE